MTASTLPADADVAFARKDILRIAMSWAASARGEWTWTGASIRSSPPSSGLPSRRR